MKLTVCDICRVEIPAAMTSKEVVFPEGMRLDLCEHCLAQMKTLVDIARENGKFPDAYHTTSYKGGKPDACPDTHDDEALPPAEELFTDEEREIARTVLGISL